MKKFYQLIAAAALLSSLSFRAPAQTLLPAKQVSTDPAPWTWIPASNVTAKMVFDWLDGQLFSANTNLTAVNTNIFNIYTLLTPFRLTNSNWRVLPDTNALAPLITWIDDNWNTNIQPNEVYMPGTNIFGATYNPTTKTWTANASGVNASTNLWTTLQPADTNVQSALDAIDDWMGYANSNLNVASVAGAAKLAYNNGYGISGAPVPSNSILANSYVVWTNGLESAEAENTDVLYWGTGSNAGKLFINKAGSYLYYASMAAYALGPSYTFAYINHYRGTNWLGASPVSGMYAAGAGEPSSGAGVFVAIDAEVGDYLQIRNTCLSSTTNQLLLGAQYIFAYKIYNSD